MAINYTRGLSNIQSRKFDQGLNESLVSKSFGLTDIPDNVKYMLESMKPIEKKYNDKTHEAATRVESHLELNLNLHFKRVYRTQGSVRTYTNIKAHSDIDLLTVIDKYFYPESNTGVNYTESDPNSDINDLRSQSIKVLKDIYDEVDDSSDKCVSIFNKHLYRKVDVVFAYWYHSDKYTQTLNEHYRGIYLYNFTKKARDKKDFPFATITFVNQKGENTMDGSRKGIRLLKNLKADSDSNIELSSFHLTTIVHSVQDYLLHYNPGNEIKIAQAISEEMNQIIEDPYYRKTIKSPNSTETPLANDSIVPEIEKLKSDLDTLILDTYREVTYSPSLKRLITEY